MTRRPAAVEVGSERVIVRLIDGLPAPGKVAERLGDELDMPRPRAGPVPLGKESARVREPPRQREVVQADPGLEAGGQCCAEHVTVVADGSRVWPTWLGFHTCPVDREPRVVQPELGQQPEVVGVPGGEPILLTRNRRVTGPL